MVTYLASRAAKAGITIDLTSSNFDFIVTCYDNPVPAGKPYIDKWAMEDFGGFADATCPTTPGIFNGPGSALWSKGWLAPGITPPVNPGELERYDPARAGVSGGFLHLSLVPEPESCGGKARPYASGMINSNGKSQFTYGFMEARIWPPGRGRIINWPAFWADGQNWPQDGEIDVMEGLGGQACWHFVHPGGVPGGCARGHFANGWHTYGADWEPGSITSYYYDGHPVGTVKSGVTSAPMYLILNNATAHQYGIPVQVPATMGVDYMRVWQHAG